MVDFDAETKSLDLHGQQVVVLGGSNGIGKGLARFYASKGASVLILGQTPSAGQTTLSELQAIVNTDSIQSSDTKKPRVSFIQADLSLVKGIYKAADDIKEWAGEKGVQYLFQSQGRWLGPPTTEGLEPGFVVQVLSRFALAYLLSESGVLTDGSTVILVAGAGMHGNKSPIIDDLDLLKTTATNGDPGIAFRREHMTSTIDVYTKELSLRYPKTRFLHIYPGRVKSELIKRADQMPYLLRFIAGILFAIPGIARTPDQYAPIAAYTVAITAKTRDDLCWGVDATPVTLCATAGDEKVRKELWAKLVETLEAHK